MQVPDNTSRLQMDRMISEKNKEATAPIAFEEIVVVIINNKNTRLVILEC